MKLHKMSVKEIKAVSIVFPVCLPKHSSSHSWGRIVALRNDSSSATGSDTSTRLPRSTAASVICKSNVLPSSLFCIPYLPPVQGVLLIVMFYCHHSHRGIVRFASTSPLDLLFSTALLYRIASFSNMKILVPAPIIPHGPLLVTHMHYYCIVLSF